MLAAAGLLVGCTGSDSATTDLDDLDLVVEPAWADHFEERGVVGTFVLHRIGDDHVMVHDPARAQVRAIPASTFKILNSAIALETGVVADVDTVIPWDGIRREFEAWNRDQTLRSAIEVSAVWAYQELARRVGAERMAEHVAAADYGNADIGGPIDEFWLRGELRISAMEQLQLLASLINDRLPFSPENQAAVREILIRDEGPNWVLGHKTGTALATEPVLGWLVGYTQHDGDTWVFALNLDLGIDSSSGAALDGQLDPQLRQRLATTILVEAGALPDDALT